uniref:Polysaccharide deacetylase family protein n=1 Tax=candidate division WOR-3 bacterium TaxID=2052148 RepID=A0A7C6AH32_UNCW3
MLKALQFHRITEKFQFCGTWDYPEQLALFIKTIYDNGYEIILPGEKKDGIVITFDDGEENIYEYAFPVLKKYRCPAIIFLIVDYIGKKNYWDLSITGRNRHLNWRQILEMNKYGIIFGSHTMSHRNLTRLNTQELEYELVESKRMLERHLGTIDAISYPFNRVNPYVLKKVAEAGYRFGFGGNGESNLTIKKEAIYITDNPFTLKIKLSEKPSILYFYERLQQKVINYFTIATMLNKKGVL